MPDQNNNIPLIGGLTGALGGLFGIFNGFHQNHLANQIHPEFHPYTESPYAKSLLGVALNAYNGAMPGYTQQQQQIAGSQANYANSIDRNATDSSQALALEGLSQGVSNNAYSNLNTQQAQYRSATLNNLNDAYKTMIGEGDKSYQSYLQKYMQDVQTQAALRGAGVQNIVGGFNNIGANLIGYGTYKNTANGGY